MNQRCLGSVAVLLMMFSSNACVSRPLAPPRCDLATAVPINGSKVSTDLSTSVAPPELDPSESTATQEQRSKDEVRTL